MSKPIQIKNLSLSFFHKTCFEDFTTQIMPGSRIAIIGRNGSGKTTLLKILLGEEEPTSGKVIKESDLVIGFVPQIVESFDALSGGQRLNAALTKALSLDPAVLLLDEPTNHLDRANRKSLMRMLQSYHGTLIIVSHDTELLRACVDTLWHIEDGRVRIFTGNYDDYMHEMESHRLSLESEIHRLDRQKKDMHHSLMQEQKRAAKSSAQGKKNKESKKWPTLVATAKALSAESTGGRKKAAIDQKKQALSEKLSSLRLPEELTPRFSLTSAEIGDRTIISVSEGSVGYVDSKPILGRINLSIGSRDRICIAGDNASGKSTLIKAFLQDTSVIRSGDWYVCKVNEIGYLDQHYKTLSAEKSVYETIADLVPTWSMIEVRRHLNDFLFRKNEEVDTKVAQLSGGEKARLSLAQIAAHTPKVLILDEITNNLDLETKAYVAQVLKAYPGALIVISHDADFLDEIGIDQTLQIIDFK